MASNQKKRMLAIAIAGATAAGSTVTFAPSAKAYTQQQVQQQVIGSGNDLPFNSGWVVRESTHYITFDEATPTYYMDLYDCYEWRIVSGKEILNVSPNVQQDEWGNVWTTGIKLSPAQENLSGTVELQLRDQHGNITIYYLCITNNMITGEYPSNPVVRTVTETAAPVTVTQTETQDPKVVEVTKTIAAQPVTETKTVTPEVRTETFVTTVEGEPSTVLATKTVTPEPKVVEVTKTVEGKPVVETKTETLVAEPVTKTVTPEPKVVEVTKTVEGEPVVETKTETFKPEVVTETVTRTETETAAPVTVTDTAPETQEPKVVEVTKTVEGEPVIETKTVTPEVITETVTHYPKPEEPVVQTVTKTVTPEVETPAPVTETVTTTLPVEKDSEGNEIIIVNNNVNNNYINTGGTSNPNQPAINSNTSEVVVTEGDADGSIQVSEARLSKEEGDHVRVAGTVSIDDSAVVISDESKLIMDRNEAGEIILVATDEAQVGDKIVVKIGEKTIINVTITEETVENPIDYSVSVVEKTIKNNQDVVLEGNGSYEVVKGEDQVIVYKDETGEFRFIPVEGATGEVVVEETVDGMVVTRYVFTITDQEITREVTTTNTGSVSVTVTPESNEVRVAEGSEDLVEVKKDENGKWIVLPKGPVGTAVVEIVHPETGRVVGRYNIDIQPSIKNYKILSIQKLKINPIVDGNKLVVVEGGDLGELDGNVFVPNDDAQGRATVHEMDADGNIVGKYIIDITRGAFTHELREKDQFLIAWDENTRVDITNGEDIVDVKVETVDGRKVWVVTPKPGKEGTAVLDLIKTINGEERVVSRYYLNVKKDERNVRIEDEYSSNGETVVVTPGKKGSTLKVLEGGSLVDVKENSDGSVEIIPKDPKKTGGVVVVSIDEDGNVDKQINIGLNNDDPDTEEGAKILMPEDGKDGRSISIKLPKDKGDLKLVGKDGEPLDSESGLELIENEDGTYELKWSGDANKTPEFKLQWFVDGKLVEEHIGHARTEGGHTYITFIQNPGGTDIDTNIVENGSANGSSVKDLDGKCIAGIVGLAAPLLLAIPVAVLSQVQIPGLEGISGQINGAIQDVNTRIQQGLGIFNEDRASRAAGFQGAFNIQNPEMLGMAGGAIAAITLGLLAIDGLMRACGAEEYTSSYQVGKATGNEKLMGLSSTKVDKDTDAKGDDSSEK